MLLLTVGLALGVIESKARRARVELGPEMVYRTAGLRARLPKGWEAVAESELPPGIVVQVVEPGRETPRSVCLFRRLPVPLELPSVVCPRVVEEVAGLIAPDLVKMSVYDQTPGLLAGLPAWTVGLKPILGIQGARPQYFLGKTALAPSGEMVGIGILTPMKPRSSENDILDLMGEQLSLFDVITTTQADEVMSPEGIRFTPPEGARFVLNHELEAARVQLMVGQGLDYWFADIHRVPLVEGRTIDQLVEDQALNLLQLVHLSQPVQRIPLNGRKVAQLRLSVLDGQPPNVLVQAAEIDDSTALVLLGRGESRGFGELCEQAQRMMGEARVESITSRFDLEAAGQTAARHLDRIRGTGVEDLWKPKPGDGDRYDLFGPAGLRGGTQQWTYQRSESSEGWWSIQVMTRREGPFSIEREIRTQWLISGKGDAHRRVTQIVGNRTEDKRYQEGHAPDSDFVTCELTREGGGGPRSVEVEATSNYACEPLLLEAAGKVALDPDRRPALFKATEAFCTNGVPWLMTPLGDRSLPAGGSEQAVSVVQLQRDYSPAPIALYYDQDATLVGMGFDDGTWYELNRDNLGTRLLQRFLKRGR